ncbi:cupredoxin domain-containing protein [Streptomyces sp. SID3212]|uniref:cupredoxin domain-containing protein n=1 Tax=Streptomyces sp. SID3212 TaxID=2690259 RepID=UPI0013693094|nr:cupredoxin domain-containing protein [Streptomyces sp. SID3212]MYV53964.1 metal-binding protein [Streptomyces sp. SID3212]
MPSRRPGRLALALAFACLTAVAGCSSDNNNSGSSDSSSAPASSAPASSAPASSSPPSSASPSSASPSSNAKAKISIKNFKFMPDKLTVAPGTKITVTNNDTTTHTLTAITDKAWNTGDIAPGKSATFTAPTKPGAYKYMCTIHPFMKGTLTVR